MEIDTSCRYKSNDQVVIEATDDESGEPYATMSVCLAHERVKPGHTFIDTNNLPDALEILVSNKVVEPTGKIGRSGFCEYPEVRVL